MEYKVISDRASTLYESVYTNLIWILLLVVALVYAPTLNNGFVSDDMAFFMQWTEVQPPIEWVHIFSGSTPHGHEGVYRPLRGGAYAMLHAFFDVTPQLVHGLGLLLHLTMVWLVYQLGSAVWSSNHGLISAAWFGLHPLTVEAIANGTGAMDMLGVLVGVWGIYWLVRYSGTKHRRKSVASLFLTCSSVFFYELCLPLPVIYIALEYWLSKKRGKTVRPAVVLACLATLGGYVGLRWYFDVPFRSDVSYSFSSAVVLPLFLLGTYVKYFFWPWPLSINHQMADMVMLGPDGINAFAISALSPWSWQVLLGVSVLVTSFLMIYFRRNVATGYLMAVVILLLLPGLHLFGTRNLFQERYAYMALVAVALLVAHVSLNMLKSKLKTAYQLLIMAGFIVMVIVFGDLTHDRIYDWRNDLSLWSSAFQVNRDHPVVLYNLGQLHAQQGKTSEAAVYYEQAIDEYPAFVSAMVNLGVLIYDSNPEKARVLFEEAHKVDPAVPQASFNLGNYYFDREKHQQAIFWYEEALGAYPDYEAAQLQLAISRQHVVHDDAL